MALGRAAQAFSVGAGIRRNMMKWERRFRYSAIISFVCLSSLFLCLALRRQEWAVGFGIVAIFPVWDLVGDLYRKKSIGGHK